MAGFNNFRPAGVSDDDDSSDNDDFMSEYKRKEQSLKDTDSGKNVEATDTIGNKVKPSLQLYNNKQPTRRSIGKCALPLDDFRNAATKGDLYCIKRCLDEGVSVDQLLTTGWTALMYAGTMANYDVMKYLLDNGADPNFHCNHYSILMATCGSTRCNEDNILKCVQVLVGKNVDVNAFDRHHMSALLYASRVGRPKVVQKLLDHGSNIDKQDNRGYTALHWASYKGHVMVVQVLIERGADIFKKTSDGSLPGDIAYVNGKERICSILQSASSRKSSATEPATSGRHSCDQLVPNGGPLYNGIANSEDKTDLLLQVVGSSSKICTYGDLEVYLSGLELSQYIQIFQKNHVTFQAFLRMTDHDLQQLGIHQMGHRKKILDASHATHKKDWESSSLASIQYNKQLKCSEAIATISNINKHTSYISSTVGYITDQIKAHPEILRSGQDGSSIDDLMTKSREGFTNIKNLYLELSELNRHLNQVSGMENFHPPELIQKDVEQRTSVIRPKNIFLSLMGISVILVVIWKHKSFPDYFQKSRLISYL